MNKATYFQMQKNRYKEGELAWCAKQARELRPEDAAHIIRVADETARLEFLFDLPWDMERTYKIEKMEYPINWEYKPADDVEFIYQMNRHRYFICLGQAYAMTGEERYAKAFVDMASDWIEHVPLTSHSHGTTWREIEAGIRGENWVKAILYFENSPSVSDTFMELFTDSLRQHGEYLLHAKRGFQISSNWGVLENNGLLQIGLALGEESYVEAALERLKEEARVQVFPDGVHWEQSCMYHNEVLHCFLEVLYALHCSGRELPVWLVETAARMAMADVAWMKPNRCQPLTGDSDETDLRDMLAAAAIVLEMAGRDESRYLKGCGDPFPDYESIWNFRQAGDELYRRIKGELPGKTDFFLEDSGNYYLRSGWGREDHWLHFRNGCLGGGHGHSDKLHLDMVYGGEDVLVDAGRYQYTYHEDKRVWLKSAHGHNTILVDGKDYMEYPDAWGSLHLAPELRFPVISRGGVTLLEGAHTGYLQEGINVLLNRKILVLEPGVYLLADTAYTSETHMYSRLFHFDSRGEAVYKKDRILYNSRKKIKTELIFPDTDIQMIPVKSRMSYHYNECEENACVMVNTEAKGRKVMFSLIASGQEEPSIELGPVWNPVKECFLEDQYAQAVKLRTDRHVYTVIFRYQDLSGPCDLLQADSCRGIGRILISADKKQPIVFS